MIFGLMALIGGAWTSVSAATIGTAVGSAAATLGATATAAATTAAVVETAAVIGGTTAATFGAGRIVNEAGRRADSHAYSY